MGEKQCEKCMGTGFLQYKKEDCEVCGGEKCSYCKYSGLKNMPWDLCYNCYGDGYFIIKNEEKKNE